jgi:NAD(P)-dependent dehydrogenase (short-subunit alcohol dehydrogenase family)
MTEERVGLVSGANRGIGEAIARFLGAAGWRLSLGMRSPQLPDWADPDHVQVVGYDASDPSAEATWAEQALARFGRIDAIIANAGIMIPKSVPEASDADLDALLDVNVKSPLRLVRAAWPWLVRSGRGRVIVLASLSAKRVKTARAGIYSMSKFAVLALTHAVRHAGWDAGIRATAVCPGFVATDMSAGLSERPPQDMTRPTDLASIVALLLDLPNSASVAEIPVNSTLEESY